MSAGPDGSQGVYANYIGIFVSPARELALALIGPITAQIVKRSREVPPIDRAFSSHWMSTVLHLRCFRSFHVILSLIMALLHLYYEQLCSKPT